MTPAIVTSITWVVVIVVFGILFRRSRRRKRHIGTGAAGAVYGMLNEDKRNAIEIIIEERAEARDPEDKDGNLPDLEDPRKQKTRAKGQPG